MSVSLVSLLAGIIDYAGLFPPAKLPFDQAIRNYIRYRSEPEAWMLGRFILPAARLAELGAFRQEAAPLALSVLGRGGGSIREFLQGLADDLEAILAFHHEWGEPALVEVLELRLPADLLAADRLKDLRTAVQGPRDLLEKAGLPSVLTCIEIERGPNWLDHFGRLAEVLLEDSERRLGFKLRCGGLEASAFPAVDDVSFVLTACRHLRVPLKFTAGLHHPIRRFDPTVQTKMHGFVNVFVAGVLAQVHELEEEQVRAIVADEDATHFRFDDDGLWWKDQHATHAEIVVARHEAVTSFGSCSFDEPRDDLRALGWL